MLPDTDTDTTIKLASEKSAVQLSAAQSLKPTRVSLIQNIHI